MRPIDSWLGTRRPPPPPDLASHLAVDDAEGPLTALLTAAARRRLDLARARPGRVRESAFRLLEADALLTYACEAALDSEDPEGTLRWILAEVAS